MPEPRTSFGWDVPSAFGPRGILSHPEASQAGNVVLAAGQEIPDGGGWYKTGHVVLSPDEARELVGEILALLPEAGS